MKSVWSKMGRHCVILLCTITTGLSFLCDLWFKGTLLPNHTVCHLGQKNYICVSHQSCITWYWNNTHAEEPCKAYCRVAMETNLPASLSLSVLRFAWEFVLLQILYQMLKTEMKRLWLDIISEAKKKSAFPKFPVKTFCTIVKHKVVITRTFNLACHLQTHSILTAGMIKVLQRVLWSTWLTGSTIRLCRIQRQWLNEEKVWRDTRQVCFTNRKEKKWTHYI